MDLIQGQGNKIPNAEWQGQKKKKASKRKSNWILELLVRTQIIVCPSTNDVLWEESAQSFFQLRKKYSSWRPTRTVNKWELVTERGDRVQGDLNKDSSLVFSWRDSGFGEEPERVPLLPHICRSSCTAEHNKTLSKKKSTLISSDKRDLCYWGVSLLFRKRLLFLRSLYTNST